MNPEDLCFVIYDTGEIGDKRKTKPRANPVSVSQLQAIIDALNTIRLSVEGIPSQILYLGGPSSLPNINPIIQYIDSTVAWIENIRDGKDER